MKKSFVYLIALWVVIGLMVFVAPLSAMAQSSGGSGKKKRRGGPDQPRLKPDFSATMRISSHSYGKPETPFYLVTASPAD